MHQLITHLNQTAKRLCILAIISLGRERFENHLLVREVDIVDQIKIIPRGTILFGERQCVGATLLRQMANPVVISGERSNPLTRKLLKAHKSNGQ